MKRRRGASLIEMMVVMAVMTAVLSTVGVLFHRLFQTERLSTRLTLVELTTMRLADQFRRDVHAAQSVTRTSKPDDSRSALELQTAATSKIVYTAETDRVQREVVDTTGTTSRELYRLPGCQVRFPEPQSASTTPEFVSLILARPHATLTASPQATPTLREIIVDAELGRDLRLARSTSVAATDSERKEP